jgi:hypothetical protein
VKMTVYLPDDLAAEIRELEDVNISSICQGALRAELDRKGTGEEPRGGKKTIADYLTGPFTKNIDDYLVWLEGQIGPFAEIAPRRLAGLAVRLYKKYQVSPERRAARGLAAVARNTGEEPRGGKKTIADYLAGPFTEKLDDYLVWLEGQIGPFAEIAPRRLAGLAITLWRR